MEENCKASVTLVDLIRLFKKKFVLLVVVALLAAIACGVCGAFLNVRSTTYRAVIEISISPTNGSNILYRLRSGRFAEQMLMEENELPPKDQCNAADYEAAEKALAELDAARTHRIEKYEEASRHYVADVEHAYKALTEEYESVLTLLKMYLEVQDAALVSPTHEAKIALYEAKLDEVEREKKEYYDSRYAPAIERKYQLETELAQATDTFVDKKKEADAAVEKVMAAWRQTDGVSGRISALMSYVTYEYHILEQETAKDAESKATEAGYILVKIEVPASAVPESHADGTDYVQTVVDCFELHLTDCVCDILEEDLTVYEAECTVTNPLIRIQRTPGSVINAAIQYGVIGAIVGVVLAYLILALRLALQKEEERSLATRSDRTPPVAGSEKK